MFLTAIDAVLAALALRWSAENLDPGFQLGLLIVVVAIVWHFVR